MQNTHIEYKPACPGSDNRWSSNGACYSDEERILCWYVYPGAHEKEHYILPLLFVTFLIFLPVTELVMLIVTMAQKPMPDADELPIPACIAPVQAACVKALDKIQTLCLKAITKFQTLVSSKDQRNSGALVAVYNACSYMPATVLLVLAGTKWEGRYGCSFSGGGSADRFFLGESLSLMVFAFSAVVVVDKLTAPAIKLTAILTTRFPALRQLGLLLAVILCLAFFAFVLFVTIGESVSGLLGTCALNTYHLPYRRPVAGTKFSEAANIELAPIFVNLGFHFSASFDAQMPTLNVAVSAKIFQVAVSTILTVIQVNMFPSKKARAKSELIAALTLKVNGVPKSVALSLESVLTAYFDGAYDCITQRDDHIATNERRRGCCGSPTEQVQEQKLAKEIVQEAHAAGLESMKAAMKAAANNLTAMFTGVEPNRESVVAHAEDQAAAAYDCNGVANEISGVLIRAGIDNTQLHARASECVKTVMVDLAKETAGVLFDATAHLLTTTKKPTIADLQAAVKAKSDEMCAAAKAQLRTLASDFVMSVATSVVGEDTIDAATSAKEVFDTAADDEPIKAQKLGEITLRIMNKWGLTDAAQHTAETALSVTERHTEPPPSSSNDDAASDFCLCLFSPTPSSDDDSASD